MLCKHSFFPICLVYTISYRLVWTQKYYIANNNNPFETHRNSQYYTFIQKKKSIIEAWVYLVVAPRRLAWGSSEVKWAIATKRHAHRRQIQSSSHRTRRGGEIASKAFHQFLISLRHERLLKQRLKSPFRYSLRRQIHFPPSRFRHRRPSPHYKNSQFQNP